MDLPEEILAKIFTDLQEDAQTTGDFHHLRIAFTCRSLYAKFQPLIEASQCKILIQAAEEKVLRALDDPSLLRCAIPEPLAQPERTIRALFDRPRPSTGRHKEGAFMNNEPSHPTPAINPPFNVALTVKSYDTVAADVNLIWSLHGLIARRQVSLHRFSIAFETESQWPSWGLNHQNQWGRAVLKLLELVVSHGGVELELTARSVYHSPFDASRKNVNQLEFAELVEWSQRLCVYNDARSKAYRDGTWPTHAPKGTTVITNEEFDEANGTWHFHSKFVPQALAYRPPESALVNVRLSTLHLKGPMFHPALFPFVDPLVSHSLSSLTELHLSGCGLGPADWNEMLHMWTFSQLTHFSIERVETIPIIAIGLFLRNNAKSLQDIWMIMYTEIENLEIPLEGPSPFTSRTPLPNLQTLFGTPEILHPLFQQLPLSYPNLDSLTISEYGKTPHAPLGDLADVTGIFSRIPQCAPGLRRVALDLTFTPELIGWMESAYTGSRAATHAQQTLYNSLSEITSVKSLSLRAHVIPQEGSTGHWPPRIYVPSQSVSAFVGAFQSVETVDIDTLFYCPPDEEEFWSGMREVWIASKSLQRLELSGIRGSSKTVVWRRGEVSPSPGYETFARNLPSRTRKHFAL
ncbi:hypothetical protein DFP72DRAFT_925938 [Ephemerocybe angulata]|uniref:Uncharacterized protein n=1 Tax=Ephemerocybe angulata TaxID=980116 RepID=A0A8H6LWQ4_9AGAR|nr:hypothetical protein DFP72DRAFT_925938 [Tulosesus angulatus]